ncbi:MAG: hypothetical protein ACOZAK_03060 [Patescibacteria group bacterium]
MINSQMEKQEKTIQELWLESDKKNKEILKNPLKDPLHFLRLILFLGITKKNFSEK